MNVKRADVWVVAGPPGSGKSTVADILISLLSPPPALLDKDTMYSSFVEATLTAANRPIGEREGAWYDEHIKVHEYAGMTAVAREIRSKGCPVLLCAPFTKQIHDRELWKSWVDELGGESVRLVWVRTDAETLKHNLMRRGLERDAMKLAGFDKFIESMYLDKEPVVKHVAIDNRLSATDSIKEQLERYLSNLTIK